MNKLVNPTSNKDNIEVLFDLASRNAAMGQFELAREQYLQILRTEPTHLETLINFAVLLVDAGYTSAAKTAYLQALNHHPNNRLANINLANLYFMEREFEKAKIHYKFVLGVDLNKHPIDAEHQRNTAHAHQGLALVYFEEGNHELAAYHHAQGYALETVRVFQNQGNASPKSLLVFIAGRGGDVPWRSVVDSAYFKVHTIAVDYFKSMSNGVNSLPMHDLIFNAIGDADSSAESLNKAIDLIDSCGNDPPRPLINDPIAVLKTGRLNNARRFGFLEGVRTPKTYLLKRGELDHLALLEQTLAQTLEFPLVVRSLGFQTGQHFEYVADFQDLIKFARTLPGDQLLLMEFLNACDKKGFFRKYRVMSINGELFPLHLALSKHWKVHYFSAAMKDSPENRVEEQHFLEHMNQSIGRSAFEALKTISELVGLDYAGIDFGLSDTGEVLFFEANSTMVMALPPVESIWDYRRGAILAAKHAATQMLIQKSSL
jgi:tetratricopeptide (TPR) repeat protein